MRSQPTSCFADEPPFPVANAVWPISFSVRALYTSIGELPVKIECCKQYCTQGRWLGAQAPPSYSFKFIFLVTTSEIKGILVT